MRYTDIYSAELTVAQVLMAARWQGPDSRYSTLSVSETGAPHVYYMSAVFPA